MLEAFGLSFGYGEKTVLSEVCFSAPRGRIVALIGPNGSGKSTLLRCLRGLLPAREGSVRLFGRPLRDYSPSELSRRVAFLPQSHERVPPVPVCELVGMGRSPYHRTGWVLSAEDRLKIDWAIDYMQLDGLRSRPADSLSGGERQRAWIAMVLAQDTPVILLDEPVTYMDLRFQRELLAVLVDLRDRFTKTIVSVFHDINHALEIADAVYLLKDGRIHGAGESEQVVTESSIRDVFQVGTHLCRFSGRRRAFVVPHGIDNPSDSRAAIIEKGAHLQHDLLPCLEKGR